eukprot:1413750-Prymnesium_polylepis.3
MKPWPAGRVSVTAFRSTPAASRASEVAHRKSWMIQTPMRSDLSIAATVSARTIRSACER